MESMGRKIQRKKRSQVKLQDGRGKKIVKGRATITGRWVRHHVAPVSPAVSVPKAEGSHCKRLSSSPHIFVPESRSMQASLLVPVRPHARVSTLFHPPHHPCSLVSGQAVTLWPLKASQKQSENGMQCAFTFQSWGETTGCLIS